MCFIQGDLLELVASVTITTYFKDFFFSLFANTVRQSLWPIHTVNGENIIVSMYCFHCLHYWEKIKFLCSQYYYYSDMWYYKLYFGMKKGVKYFCIYKNGLKPWVTYTLIEKDHLWRWLPHRLLKRQSQTTVLHRTSITQMIFFNQGIFVFLTLTQRKCQYLTCI